MDPRTNLSAPGNPGRGHPANDGVHPRDTIPDSGRARSPGGRMRAVVTGGSGFIGSTLVDQLIEIGHEVVVVDDLSTGQERNLSGALASGQARLERLDVAGPEAEALIAAVRPEVVYHLAAQMDVRRSVEDPLHDARVNVIGSIRVARAAAAGGCRRFVFAGSGGTAYGEPDPAELPVSERAPMRVSNPYGVAKRTVEDYLGTFTELWGLEPVSLRLANVYGARQNPHGEAGVVAIFCSRLLRGEPVTIYGDGRQTRDYVHVDDVVAAFLAAGAAASEALTARHPEDEGTPAGTLRLNIGTGQETSVVELYETLRRVAGQGGPPSFAPARQGELQRVALDAGRASRLLGWTPKVDLTEGLARTWEWARRELGG
jgi:UDP-glucose 4-epimerase